MDNKNSAFAKFMNNKIAVAVTLIILLAGLFAGVFFLTTFIYENTSGNEPVSDEAIVTTTEKQEETTLPFVQTETTADTETTTQPEVTTATVTKPLVVEEDIPGNTAYPSDDASWKLICLNKNRYIGSSVEKSINLSYVAGSGELMDSRAARAYEQMYDAAAAEGIYLTPCSGYRSYSTQKRLYYEFYYEYINQGYSSEEAHALTSKRRNPPGSSEHNIGICMDIICASSSANFQNTQAYAWLDANAHNYGFILRYPADKVAVTGVKYEPWHWRYVGVENAAAIKNSGLCLEEYLGVS